MKVELSQESILINVDRKDCNIYLASYIEFNLFIFIYFDTFNFLKNLVISHSFCVFKQINFYRTSKQVMKK